MEERGAVMLPHSTDIISIEYKQNLINISEYNPKTSNASKLALNES